ncbi:uncharacterized protein LOC129348650 [Amphiprion ocellaris]|uniref:uncharacterized protein LOC129348650 n=1 Tax=Amphiprion ocellaris TaxID=80972 RepID=UPI002410CDD6|nr:uncharacterized protein LOC129348650 [Amphiprion ocellaris]
MYVWLTGCTENDAKDCSVAPHDGVLLKAAFICGRGTTKQQCRIGTVTEFLHLGCCRGNSTSASFRAHRITTDLTVNIVDTHLRETLPKISRLLCRGLSGPAPERLHQLRLLLKRPSDAAISDLKEELLLSLCNETAVILKTQLLLALKESLIPIKTELQTVKSKLSVSISNIKSNPAAIKHAVGETETSLSTSPTTSSHSKAEQLSAELLKVDYKCEECEQQQTVSSGTDVIRKKSSSFFFSFWLT